MLAAGVLHGQNVGIGASNPAATLHVKGQDPNVWFTDIYPLMVQQAGGDTALIVKDNGQVFLSGNVNDFATLNIRRPATATQPHLLLEQQLAGGLATIDFVNQGGTFYWDGVNNLAAGTSFMGWFASGLGYLMYASSAGNVGIRTSSPQDRLDVNGDIRFTGDLKLTGTALPGFFCASNGTGGNAYYRNYSNVINASSDSATSVGLMVNNFNTNVTVASFDRTLTDTSKVEIMANVNMRPISNFCAPFCGPSDVIVELAARSVFSGFDLALTRQSLRLESEKTQSVSLKTVFLVMPDFSFPNAGSISFQLRVRWVNGPDVQCSPPFPETVLNKLNIKIMAQPD